MDGLERVDKPGRWPWAVAAVLLVVVAALAGWIYSQRVKTPVEPHPAVGQTAAGSDVSAPSPVSMENSVEIPAVAAQPAVIVEEKAPPPVLPVADEKGAGVVAIVAEAEALLTAGKKDASREKYLEALAAKPNDATRLAIEDKLGALSVEMIRLPWPMVEKQEYVVQTNDAIKFIARKFGTTVEMIVKGNELKRPDVIRPGQRLKVFAGKMEMVVSKSRHDLLLTANGRFFKRYPVATGRYEKTPVGTFAIAERIPEPPWHRDDGKIIPFGDKENILGTRWMAIKATGQTPEIRGYGIHGTWDNASIGKSESAGCIRLRNEDVEELFEMVPVGTSVVIQE